MTVRATPLATLLLAAAVPLGVDAEPPREKDVIELWREVQAPPTPAVVPVTLDPKTSAVLVLDMQTQLANPTSRPRALATAPAIAALVQRARTAGVLVVYSLTPSGTKADILPELAPRPGDPVVQSAADKFFKTDLEAILASHGVQTVVVTGTRSQGAVLYTASGAALRGLEVVVPVDGMSSDERYAEQYVAWHFLNSPATQGKARLSRCALVTFGAR